MMVCLPIEVGKSASAYTAAGDWLLENYEEDPITRLMSFPCFVKVFKEAFIPDVITRGGVGIAIGDVDDLKTYVETRREVNPKLFGHLAGNAFMCELGNLTRKFFGSIEVPSGCVSSFGGDEVIMVVSGCGSQRFSRWVGDLAGALSDTLPRSVSFAYGWFDNNWALVPRDSGDIIYDTVGVVDRALFEAKHARKSGLSVGGGRFICDAQSGISKDLAAGLN